ncbi:MAG: hypothetical protein KJ958_12170 [Gammaproteobacteria bacterium]|nr:hypothetical protein [Gammaproteobacteria bacterium]MBU1979912.1 hypothetical protein [Gammaproteobacteria bacterium]
MSISVKVEGRNTVSVGFITGTIVWSDVSISAIENDSQPVSIQYVMLNCKDKMYSTYPEPAKENAYSLLEYKAGMKYKWGDYSAQDLLFNVSDEYKIALTKYFKTVCEYTAQ